MSYTDISTRDDQNNSADFFLRIGEKGSGYTDSDIAITIVIVSDEVCGKHTFYTTEDPIAFIRGIGMEYLFEKYGVKEIFDLNTTIVESIRKVLEYRRNQMLGSYDAREYYNFLDSLFLTVETEDEFWAEATNSLWSLGDYQQFFEIHTKWGYRQVAFFNTLWAQFVDEISPDTDNDKPEQTKRAVECHNCGIEFIYDEEIDALPYSRTTASGDHYKCSVCGEEI